MIRNRWLAGTFSLGLLGAVLWPIVENWRPEPRDDFPLSYYPMFSARRGKRTKVNYMIGLDAAGRRVYIPHRLIGQGGFNQTRRQVNRIVRRGDADTLLRKVTPRIFKKYPELVTVQLVTGTYELKRFFSGDRTPHAEEVHAEAHRTPVALTAQEV
jgi:hypothetical protein